ncbi:MULTISPECIES: DUF3138 family protein [Aquitalea]|uniref:Uncharacterized protein DUF3138 n=1 Tax=Aquitalea magnusonii TaxID=332411 RepID=A0A318JUP2_9NEIS|nr:MULTISPECIES: DUF3138 family protein [Aquitalea]PXX48332.1 uncharacterized protein DUF3138 [Aquitalea magnusonii]
MKKLLISALIAGLPGVAMADAKGDEIAKLKAQLEALQAQMQQLQQAVNAATAAKAPEADDANTELKQRVAGMELKVDKLTTDASEGPIAGLSVTGYLDPTYLYNRSTKGSGFQFVNHSNQYAYTNSTFGDVYLDIKKTFGVGPLAPSAEISILPNRGSGNTLLQSSSSSGGSNNGSGSTGLGNIINTAVITYPLSDTTQLVAGLMNSFGGYEVQQSNQMNTITHGLLYDFSDPGGYVGAGFNWAHGEWATKFMIANEQYHTNANLTNGKSNNTPTVTGRVDYTWSSALDIGASANAGRQTLPGKDSNATGTGYGYQGNATSPYSNYYFAELDATYTMTDGVLNAELDYGRQKQAAWNGEDAVWYGFSLLAHQKWTSELFGRMGATLRYDYLNDSKNGGGGGGIALSSGTGYGGVDGTNGFGISQACFSNSSVNGSDCSGATRQALTAALLFYPTDQLTLKMEYRHDWANRDVFVRNSGNYRKSNDIFAAQAVYSF